MLETIQEDIIAELEDIEGVATVDAWQGDIDALLKTPQRLPSLHVIYKGAVFEPFEQAGENTTAALDFMIVLTTKNQKSRAAGSVSSYALIEAVRGKLTGHWVDDYDFLRPVTEDLIMAEGGIMVYGLVYRLSNVLVETA
ncbi:MAG: DUF1834 family protein [Deltaproteobacteria bacterium]|jgi:hypothetical protein|nr:MAG: DUF1834 family protein [Deltaproteobacteria bacterium]